MKRHVRSAAILFCLLLLSGCGAGIYHAIAPEGDENNLKARYEENIALFEPRFDAKAPLTNTSLMYLCEAYSKTKRFARLDQCLERMSERYQTGDRTYFNMDFQDYIAVARTKAALDLGDLAGAIALCREHLDRRRNEAPRMFVVLMLGYRGLARALSGDAAGARAELAELESISLGYPFNMVQPTRDEGEARIYMALGQMDRAYEVMQRKSLFAAFAIGVAEATFGSTGWFVFMELPRQYMKARAAYLSGRTAEALKGYDALLANPRSRENGEIFWLMLYDRGRSAESQGQPEVALRFYRQSVEVVEQQRRSIGSEASKIGFVGDKQALYAGVVDLLVRQGRPREVLEYMERAKSRALVDLLAARQGFAPEEQQSGAAQALKELASLEQRYSYVGANVEEHARLRSAMGDLTRELRRKAPELASLVTVGAPGADEILARLAPDEPLLEYYGQGDALYAVCATREAVRAVRLDAHGLEAEVRAFRQAVAQAGGEAWREPAARLYARLLAPVPGALDKPRLVIVGHGPLHYLPWAALYDGSRFLVDRVTLTLLPSASVTQFLAARKAAPARQMLLLGNPDLGDKAMDLPGAEAEARAIKGIWPDSTMLMRRAATKSALAKAGGLFRGIHVAAHGEFSSDRPLDSALLLSPEGTDDGRLTAGDLYSLRLPADLVTLSACETGLGKVLSGDDVIGLTRGFLYAGASSIVASLWPVSDEETKFLMTSFYGNLKRLPKADALRQAQLETRKRYPHPFYWSAFQLTGMGR